MNILYRLHMKFYNRAVMYALCATDHSCWCNVCARWYATLAKISLWIGKRFYDLYLFSWRVSVQYRKYKDG